MKDLKAHLLLGTAIAALAATPLAAQTTTPPATGVEQGTEQDAADDGQNALDDIIVTAQKREQAVNSVGMSITAQTGEQLQELGIRSVGDLAKIVPGFTFEGGTGLSPIYSIRGIGFHDFSLASGQTVAIYTSEVPIPFALSTVGVDFDIARVEVLKGPQGTLFGQNSTGGAINYVLARPTDEFSTGVDLTYGRFNTTDLGGFVSGPLSDTLRARVAVRSIQGDGWQKRYGPVPAGLGLSDDSLGVQNQFAGRLLLDWTPTDRLTVSLNLNTRVDRSETQAPQLVGFRPSSSNPLPPEVLAFPLLQEDNRSAAWDPGIDYSQDNWWREASVRADYDAGFATLTSISAYQRYHRSAPAREHDGTSLFVLRYGYGGEVETFYQELRASGDFDGEGSWIVGANYEHDDTVDQFPTVYSLATSRILFGLPNRGADAIASNQITTAAVYGNVEYPITDAITLQGGVRYTNSDRDNQSCARDIGNGDLAAIFLRIQQNLIAAGVKKTPLVTIQPGGCTTLDAGSSPALFQANLTEDNVSWRVGVNWTAAPGMLFYANASQGYKAGSFPIAAATSAVQFTPVVQEELLAYEVGMKARLAPNLQLNAAAFYYDYTNKQIGGNFIDPVFGRLSRLVTIPESRVQGFEASADWRPIEGLTIMPGISYVDSEILGTFSNFTPFGVVDSFVGEAFPYAPRWQGNVNVEYSWPAFGDWSAFIGGNAAYQSETNGAFGELEPYKLKAYTLVDLRAGVESASGAYRLSVWGSNVFDTYYWNTASRNFDVDARYTGQPARYGVTLTYRY